MFFTHSHCLFFQASCLQRRKWGLASRINTLGPPRALAAWMGLALPGPVVLCCAHSSPPYTKVSHKPSCMLLSQPGWPWQHGDPQPLAWHQMRVKAQRLVVWQLLWSSRAGLGSCQGQPRLYSWWWGGFCCSYPMTTSPGGLASLWVLSLRHSKSRERGSSECHQYTVVDLLVTNRSPGLGLGWAWKVLCGLQGNAQAVLYGIHAVIQRAWISSHKSYRCPM